MKNTGKKGTKILGKKIRYMEKGDKKIEEKQKYK